MQYFSSPHTHRRPSFRPRYPHWASLTYVCIPREKEKRAEAHGPRLRGTRRHMLCNPNPRPLDWADWIPPPLTAPTSS